MTLVRRLARPALSAVFVTGGIDTLKNPAAKVPPAQDIAPKIAARLPWLPQDTKSLVTINAAMQVGAGLMLATGRLPRSRPSARRSPSVGRCCRPTVTSSGTAR